MKRSTFTHDIGQERESIPKESQKNKPKNTLLKFKYNEQERNSLKREREREFKN